jgi:hypothetical protein
VLDRQIRTRRGHLFCRSFGNGRMMANTKSKIMTKITIKFGTEMESQPHPK